MATIEELPWRYRAFVRTYAWPRVDPVPWTPLRRSVAASRVAIVSSAALALPDQPPFDESVRGGDASFRIVPAGADVSTLRESHRSKAFDHAGLEADRNLALPLDRLHELAAAGRIGTVAPRHLSFMGSITAPGRLVRGTAPEAAATLLADGVNAALLVPV